MTWEDIIGQDLLKGKLKKSIEEDRISHAQLFVGKSGYGTFPLVLAYVWEIFKKYNPASLAQVEALQHPDIHLSFPVINLPENKAKKPTDFFVGRFREFVKTASYSDLNSWYEYLEEDKKQGVINVKEVEAIIEGLSLKSFEGGYKVQIIWMADKMNIEASNKLLKILEEPEPKTLFLLITEDDSKILQTIKSRCQKIAIPAIEDVEIQKALIEKYSINQAEAESLARRSEGDWNKALSFLNRSENEQEFERYFIEWNRYAFMVGKNTSYLQNIVQWSTEVASWGREKQKNFLEYCGEIFRQALLQNYQAQELVNNPLTYNDFKWEGFSSFINGNNIENILEEVSRASYHIERNGNPKIVFLDMGVKLTRHLLKQVK